MEVNESDLKFKVFATLATSAEFQENGCSLSDLIHNFNDDWRFSLVDSCRKCCFSTLLALLEDMNERVTIHVDAADNPTSIRVYPIITGPYQEMAQSIRQSLQKPPKKKISEELSMNQLVQKYPVSSGLKHRYLEFQQLCKDYPDIDEFTMEFERIDKIMHCNGDCEETGSMDTCKRLTILSEEELNPPDKKTHAWAKKDYLSKFQPCSYDLGLKILKILVTDFQEGQGLGLNGQGIKHPLIVEVKTNKEGLTTEFDLPPGTREMLKHKANPIEIMNAICAKKKWPAIEYLFQYNDGMIGGKSTMRVLMRLNDTTYSMELPRNRSQKDAKMNIVMSILITCFDVDPISLDSHPFDVGPLHIGPITSSEKKLPNVPDHGEDSSLELKMEDENPSSILNQICQKMKLDLPKYRYIPTGKEWIAKTHFLDHPWTSEPQPSMKKCKSQLAATILVHAFGNVSK